MEQNPFQNKPVQIRKTQEERMSMYESLHVKARIATPEDWEKLRDLRLAVLSGADKNKMGVNEKNIKFLQENSNNEIFWKNYFFGDEKFAVIAEGDSGGMGMGRAEFKKGVWWIRNMAVPEKEFQGVGIGKAMFAVRLNEIRSRGGKEVWIEIQDGNNESIGNAKSFGFKIAYPVTGEVRKILNKGFYKMKLEDVNDPEVVRRINEVINAR